ncbi:hypothetical protein AA23498_2086 [Acetobacter nitrogenifigens DSM 23921 = NBRC 105050]|uniref:SnoaL-like domain-containing protein n=2 Tax=Acetobacter nitrogenifigens TaxID=285268 RepID=A0A511XEZ9_9PROT|nr:ester cyclase [Acetobacter nitrogenifigens]GBQ94687.1 hypothetical protein AA23498_2086 [Acetobacter nitrogenifigens DSM 23921 = NBRC 105050]GEN61533.1 hypothetical protein ANI02nite_34170 [Acetobacter nitrogenifigens DSM 23921 = NBRC 105050]
MNNRERRQNRVAAFIHDVWNCGREEMVGGYIAKNYTVHHDPGDPWDGQILNVADFIARLKICRAPFPDQRFDIQNMCVNDDAVTICWLWEATQAGDLPDFPATGQRIRMSGATHYLFDFEDKISGHWQVTDRLGVFQQLQKNGSITRALSGSRRDGSATGAR